MPSEHIQWFPGHMAKTRRLITENLKNVHIIIEVLDARVPVSSRNPELRKMTGDKPTILLLNKASLADPKKSKEFVKLYTDTHTVCILCDCVTGEGLNRLPEAIRTVLKDRVERYEEKGQAGRHLRAMVVGVPNVGKSTFINKVAKRKSARAGDKPGVTRGKQWVAVDAGLDLLDTPGILWPKFEDPNTGLHLAFTGAVKDDILDSETLACHLMCLLSRRYPQTLIRRYQIDLPSWEEAEETAVDPEGVPVAYGYEVLCRAARKRGFLISGGEEDTERMSHVLLDEFRGGKLGTFTLEWPEDLA
jgi:ribosome biogenesis GTPase A